MKRLMMKQILKTILCFVVIAIVLQGCSGVRYSYKPKLEVTPEGSVLRLKEGESTEILAIGDGFPGWWGFYPGAMTSEPSVASVSCQRSRSAIPFREPGLLFGGEVCKLTAHKEGETALMLVNALNK